MTIYILTLVQSGVITKQEAWLDRSVAKEAKARWINEDYNENDDDIQLDEYPFALRLI